MRPNGGATLRTDVARDLTESAETFVRLVVPKLESMFGGRFESTESVNSRGFVGELDMLAGIDAWQVSTRHGLRGIASRVQSLGTSFDTFTIRYRRSSGAETEYAKRLRAINDRDHGWLWPHFTVQAYISKCREKLISFGIIETVELFHIVEHALQAGDTKGAYILTNSYDDNEFIVVPWARLAGSPSFREWRPEPEQAQEAEHIPRTLGRNCASPLAGAARNT